MYVVYTLVDPRDNKERYVGITDDVYARFSQHIRGDCGNIEKNNWIFECRQANAMIIMKTLEIVDSREKAEERECYWIRHFLDLGYSLSNAKVAKAILKERAKLEREVRRKQAINDKVAQGTVFGGSNAQTGNAKRYLGYSEYRDTFMPQAIEAWQQGHRTIRALASHIGATDWQSRRLLAEINAVHAVDNSVG